MAEHWRNVSAPTVQTTGDGYDHMMTSRRNRRVAAFVVAAGLLGAACGGGDDAAPTSAESPVEQVADAPDAAAVGAGETPDILQFTSSLIGGGELDAASLSDKPTAFWFWSPN